MGSAKHKQMEEDYEQFQNEERKKEGYRKHLIAKGEYSMDCPNCEAPLSHEDMKAAECRSCNKSLPWND